MAILASLANAAFYSSEILGPSEAHTSTNAHSNTDTCFQRANDGTEWENTENWEATEDTEAEYEYEADASAINWGGSRYIMDHNEAQETTDAETFQPYLQEQSPLPVEARSCLVCTDPIDSSHTEEALSYCEHCFEPFHADCLQTWVGHAHEQSMTYPCCRQGFSRQFEGMLQEMIPAHAPFPAVVQSPTHPEERECPICIDPMDPADVDQTLEYC